MTHSLNIRRKLTELDYKVIYVRYWVDPFVNISICETSSTASISQKNVVAKLTTRK